MRLLDQRARLQAGDQKHQAFDQIDDQVPEENSLQPRRKRDQARPGPAHIKAAGDGREHAGAAEMRRHPEGEIRRHKRQRDLDARLASPLAQAQAEPADREAVDELADDDQHKGAGRLTERKRAGADRDDGKAVKHERGRVIGEAFAFKHDDNPARQSQLRAIASGATTSGGEMMAPSRKPTAQSKLRK